MQRFRRRVRRAKRVVRWSRPLLILFWSGVFGVSICGMLLVSWNHGTQVNWLLITAGSVLVATVASLRAYPSLRRAYLNACKDAANRRRLRNWATGHALVELEHSMAQLSPGDLSLYHTLVVTAGDGPAQLITTVGSPNHHVLVQMTDLWLATPVDRKTIGHSPYDFESVTYAFTMLGKVQIPKILKRAIRIRHAPNIAE